MIDTDKYEGHTEGPWSIKIGLVNGYSVKDANGDHVCTIPDLTGMSNKHIIADAPLLLQALIDERAEVKRLREQNKLMVDYFRFMRDGGFTDADWRTVNEWIGDEQE
jgi:hypothetical protein